jgi:hypothetical protein
VSETDRDTDDCLFHCPDLQGVILGVGLAMLEQTFAEERRDKPMEKASKATTGKRRKATATPISQGLNDDIFPAASAGNGKKAKLGTGYAGDIKEDVRSFTYADQICSCLFCPSILVKLRLRRHRKLRMRSYQHY